ncbi:cytochrome P450 [Kitasatospora kifunensis]|uniref:Cytochrome P450 n=1 Tax=Kitasatospora kifunensis TaxID=58351 RepID=A0A7W7VSL8_KITKI|nr:cytochrome P450 [Kitasatospora kifunensis]MBB4921316.1 cytochrome P450 [Kitasatospora kifunensis]
MATAAPTPTPRLTAPAPRGACPFAPPPAYQQAHREEPISRISLWDGSTVWLVTRHQDVRAVLGDARFSADAVNPGFPFLSAGARELASGKPTFIRMDDPEHARLRRMLTGDFMIKKVEALRPEIQRIAEELLDKMIAGGSSADLVRDFALPLPSLVICLLLGVPYEEHDFFQECSRVLLRRDADPAQVRAAQDSLVDYLAKLTESKRTAPDDGILSRLVARGELTAEEIGSMGRLLLVAGHETTANMTALSVLALLRNPEQLERLREHPELIGGAVEELLRYLTIVHSGLARVATEDVTLGGVELRAGDGVILMLNTANRDEQEFPGGDDLDVSRDARRHLAFGFGVHQCLGQPLARLELQIALSTILRRLPGLRLAASFEELRFRNEMLIYGVHELPVAW